MVLLSLAIAFDYVTHMTKTHGWDAQITIVVIKEPAQEQLTKERILQMIDAGVRHFSFMQEGKQMVQ